MDPLGTWSQDQVPKFDQLACGRLVSPRLNAPSGALREARCCWAAAPMEGFAGLGSSSWQIG